MSFQIPARYPLPCSPSLVCQDRFDLLEADEWDVPFWSILKKALSLKITDSHGLINLLQTIDVTLRGCATTDHGFLQTFLRGMGEAAEGQFFNRVWPVLVEIALEMPSLFPESSLPILSEQHDQVTLSRRQVACLVVHQFLCSLPSQPWPTDSSPDFRIWYSTDIRHPKAVAAYISSVFTYFGRLAGSSHGSDSPSLLSAEWPIIFRLRTLGVHKSALPHTLPMGCMLRPMTVTYEPIISTKPSLLGIPDGACIVSANKNVGFGQSATQEEMHVGSTPESCPIVLLTPTLQDTQILVVQGAEAMTVVEGYGREARLLETSYKDSLHGVHPHTWQRRVMLFMDALEFDMYDSSEGVPDLLPGHTDRELLKAYNAFSSQQGGHTYSRIVTGLWGCGAFGGNREIKTILQWCAASLAGVRLEFICSGDAQREFADCLRVFTQMALANKWQVGRVHDLLLNLKPDDVNARGVFSYLELSYVQS
ncbi:poly(ADP-ribose) glycohydrolase [Coccidioides immitis RS]|uniref:poly(ADP-ribose) glycohydrolase n=1 Tax=Coccidioides immitis (strain RS) TaxID=246410 RepID=J3K2B5_COCIM|nr:poly(ADP-ribose) glycohydrolase [Coccidioides immitis RS]EAS28217.3 poly(ADP-ribose) glycohydrolase [Coccidioides immitis RS]